MDKDQATRLIIATENLAEMVSQVVDALKEVNNTLQEMNRNYEVVKQLS